MSAKVETPKTGTICLVQDDGNGRLVQIGLSEHQSELLQKFLQILSNEKPLVQLPEKYDFVLKSGICGNCKERLS